MMAFLISAAIAVFFSALTLIGGSVLVEALARRGYNPVDRGAALLSPTDARLSVEENAA